LTEEQAFKGGTREERRTDVSPFYQVHEFTGRLASAIFHLSTLSPFHFFSWLFGIKFARHITPLAPWRGAGGEALFILFLVYVFAFEPWRLFEHPSLVVVLVVG